ncbi:uncharacterized protein LOC125202655 [Salvia hispanica]|uniref:uncharacterized protein LOC125202655 n=1 Tax=Salvia hispanica TaxID=49212 RepID=UPI00200906F6|nr:uncharacterized protein LOC125202655 [Salvia hispanica]
MMNGVQEFPSTLPKRYNSSKRVGGEAPITVLYYGGAAGSVPFLWESQPGTPKHKLSDGPLPPLTPPPQYRSRNLASSPSLKKKHYSKIFNSIFARKKATASSSPSPSYSSSFEYEVGRDSPTSTLCFCPMKSVKKVVKSIASSKN